MARSVNQGGTPKAKAEPDVAMPSLDEDICEHPFVTLPGRSRPIGVEDRPEDKHGRSLVRQHDPQPDWGRGTETRLASKRNASGTRGLF